MVYKLANDLELQCIYCKLSDERKLRQAVSEDDYETGMLSIIMKFCRTQVH